MMNDQLPMILFDPECPLCLRFKQGLERLDKSLNFVSARESEIYERFPELDQKRCLEKIHLVTKERKILEGVEVVDYLSHHLPGISKFAWLLDNDQGKKVKEYFYQKLEELRTISLKKESCSDCKESS